MFSLNKRIEFFFSLKFSIYSRTLILNERRLWSLSFSLYTGVYDRLTRIDINTTTFDVCFTQHAFIFIVNWTENISWRLIIAAGVRHSCTFVFSHKNSGALQILRSLLLVLLIIIFVAKDDTSIVLGRSLVYPSCSCQPQIWISNCLFFVTLFCLGA